jgi:hypothetical protein
MRTFVIAALLIVGCGGGGAKGTPSPGNTATSPTAPARDPWAAVVKGATFTVDNKIEGEADLDVETLVATITDVETKGDRRVIRIAWTSEGKPLEGTSLPEEVTVAADTVAFNGYEFPLATKADLPDGRYVMIDETGATCYGEGPPADSDTPCPDVCFAHFCVHPEHGLVGGAGTWWPNYVVFERPDLR